VEGHTDRTLCRDYPAFVRHMRFSHLCEALALLIFAMAGQVFLHIGLWFLSLCTLVACFLLAVSRATPGAAQNDFALRVEYRRLFLQRQQLRRFMAWLWAAPVLAILYERFIHAGISTGRGVIVMIGSVAMISICFLIAAVNRECTGRSQEKIRLLEYRGS
jgi:hypothetical protein